MAVFEELEAKRGGDSEKEDVDDNVYRTQDFN